MRCRICGQVPRQMWLFGGTRYWRCLFTDKFVCPSCFNWAMAILVEHGYRSTEVW